MYSELAMDFDEQLQQLALEAQRHPPGSKERQLALTQLVEEIWRSGKLLRPRRGQFTYQYEDIYNEARQKLMLYICENIDHYDPTLGSVIRWVNFLMKRRFFVEAVRTIVGNPRFQLQSDIDIDYLPNQEENPTLSDLLRQWIEADPDNFLQSQHIRNHPEANLKVLLKFRLAERRWREIAEILSIRPTTLSDFFQRHLPTIAQRFKRYLGKGA